MQRYEQVPAIPEDEGATGRTSPDSGSSSSSASTTSLVFERIGERVAAESGQASTIEKAKAKAKATVGRRTAEADEADARALLEDDDPLKDEANGECDLETGPFLGNRVEGVEEAEGSGAAAAAGTAAMAASAMSSGGRSYQKMDRSLRRVLILLSVVFVTAWLAGLAVYISHKAYLHGSEFEHDPQATASRGNLRRLTREQIDTGFWRAKKASISWVGGPAGEDGLLLEKNTDTTSGQAYLTVADVQTLNGAAGVAKRERTTLVEKATFEHGGKQYTISTVEPSKDMQKVLLGVSVQKNWRHSTTAVYFVLDVASQTVQPLVVGEAEARVQLAQWSPTSRAIAFTRDNNVYLRQVAEGSEGDAGVLQITTDGGADLFYGAPDWVYEEEVLGGASATWWSPDGRYLAFLRTNETGVPSYPVQYFIQRPSGTTPEPGEENYPEVREVKYPKAGAHNPVVDLQFFDTSRGDVFAVAVADDFADDDRLITTVVWAGATKVLVKETNRVSTMMRVVVADVAARMGQTVRTVNVTDVDGGWFEISQNTRYVPADAARQRPDDGYIDTVIYNDGDHLAYFSPPENPEPVMLTTGPEWEVVDAPAAVDLEHNLVYFLATIQGSTQRHVYSVSLLDSSGLAALTNTSEVAFYDASFSAGAGYVLLSYNGPGIPWQRVVATPTNEIAAAFSHTLEDNNELAERARQHSLPLLVYGTIEVAGVEGDSDGRPATLNYVERRPPHFDPNRRYPVLFQQYSGPGSQQVKQEFSVDFQSYVAASLGYVVVTVDPRGTGFRGRRHRVVVRGRIGVVEAQDHISAAQQWAAKPYVDAERLALWGWSYGGFTTLKTLEQDAGQTFRYGIAVAPVTDWRFYDSIYTERYMDTPQANAAGYDASTVMNATALAQNVRFLVMHGVADDNVHFQNSLTLLDRLDLAGASNYDVHVFPDSDHSIFFHDAHPIVFDKLENWLVNAFNGEWLKVAHAKPHGKR